MSTDRTADFRAAVDGACTALGLSEEETRRAKQALLMKPAHAERSQFASVAEGAGRAIRDLQGFIAAQKRDYLSLGGKMADAARDEVEQRVGGAVRDIAATLDALKEGVVAAQAQAQTPRGGGGGGVAGNAPLVNEQTAAHLHGAVLVLAERLQGVAAGFDRCRAVRYQQSLAKELRQHRRPAAPAAASSSAAAALAGSRGAQQRAAAAGGGEPSGGGGGGRGGAADEPGGGGGGQQQQQQQQLDATRALLEELRASARQAGEVERTMRQVTTLNQMISTAVMQQAEQIEQLYNDAVDASFHVRRGNVELRKTIAVNRSSRTYLVVLLVTAALLLLFFDWFHS